MAVNVSVPLLRNIATIGVFYALPVIQLVITYQTVLCATLTHTATADLLHYYRVISALLQSYNVCICKGIAFE